MRLITEVTSLDTSSILLKRFARSGFFILGISLSLAGSCQDCTAGGEALAIHTFPKFPIQHLRHEAARHRAKWGHRQRRWRTFSGESLDAKRLAETFCSMPLLQWTPEALCCYYAILVISLNHYELIFRLLAATFFRMRRSCIPLTGMRFQLWLKISYPCFFYGNSCVQKLLTFCLVAS